jgi:tetratricopeptide (TPR) repeat protein
LRQEAQANEKKAQSEAAKSREVARFLRSMLSGVGPSAAKGRDTTILREILDTTAERVRNELSAQPGVEADLRITIGSVYHDLFDFKKAEQMDREAVRLRTALFGRTNELVADALCQLAFTLVYIDPAEAETRARESLAIRRGLFGTNHINVAFSLNILAAALAKQGKHAEAETVYRQGLEMSERAPGDHELNDAIMLYNLGIDLYERGKLSEAETAAREALAIERKRFEVNHPTVADTLNLLAKALRRQGEPAKLPEAETFAREALKINKKIFGDTHFQVAESLEELGFILSDEGKLTECESTFREWLSVNKQLGAQAEVASSLFNLGALLKQEGKVAEAETNYRGALAMSRELGDTNLSMLYSGANLAAMLQEQGRLAAEGADIYKGLPDTAHQVRVLLLGEWMDEVFVRERNLSDAEGRISGALGLSAASLSTNLTFLKTRAQRLARRGHWQEAAADFGCAINLSPDDNELWHSLAVVLVQSGQVDAYREHCRKAIEHFKNTVESATADRIAKDCLILPSSGVDPKTLANLADTSVTREIGPERAYVQFCKGLAEYRQGNLTSALAWVEKALTKEGEVPERDVEACAVRSMACHRLGQPEIALAALTKGKELADRKLAKPGTDDLGEGWVDWIIAQALLREAKELIESPFATAKDRGR